MALPPGKQLFITMASNPSAQRHLTASIETTTFEKGSRTPAPP